MSKINIPGLGEFDVAIDKTGRRIVERAGGKKFDTTSVYGGGIGSFTMRESGLEKEVARNEKIIQALNEPGKYLEARNAAIKALDEQLQVAYDNEIVRTLTLGYSDEKSKEMARSHMISEKNRLRAAVDNDYPTEAIETARSRLLKK